MPIQTVVPANLAIYLNEIKSEGYSIIGVEQGTNSVSLEEFVFPDRVALLLGSEKLGVPAELLALVDHLVEIPQFGLIRSLNVHVSGSLIIWEFVKQLIKKTAK